MSWVRSGSGLGQSHLIKACISRQASNGWSCIHQQGCCINGKIKAVRMAIPSSGHIVLVSSTIEASTLGAGLAICLFQLLVLKCHHCLVIFMVISSLLLSRQVLRSVQVVYSSRNSEGNSVVMVIWHDASQYSKVKSGRAGISNHSRCPPIKGLCILSSRSWVHVSY